MIAGQSAGEHAGKKEHAAIDTHSGKITEIKHRYEAILNREGPQSADWREAQWALYQIMHWYAMPGRRSESTLTAGYNQLLRLRNKANSILMAGNQHDLYHCLEVLNLLDLAELVILAVNERKESRGEAKRIDYPFMNPMLDKIMTVHNENGKPEFSWVKPR